MGFGYVQSSNGRRMVLTPEGWVNEDGVNLNRSQMVPLASVVNGQAPAGWGSDQTQQGSIKPPAPVPQPMQFDMRNPVDYMGRKGFRQADGRILDTDWNLIADLNGVARMEAQDREQKRRFMEAQIAEKFAEAKQKEAAARIDPTMPKLNPGEVFNRQTGQVEPIPGSKLYQQQADKFAADLDAMKSVEQTSANTKQKIGKILDAKNRGGFESNFGGYNAYLTQFLPGQTQDVKATLESLKSDLKMAGLNAIRAGGSIGAMTEREWPIVQDMIAKLTPTLSEDEAKTQLENIVTYIGALEKRAKDKYQTEWGDTVHARKAGMQTAPSQPSNQANQPVKVNSADEAMKLPSGTTFVTPDGRVKVRP